MLKILQNCQRLGLWHRRQLLRLLFNHKMRFINDKPSWLEKVVMKMRSIIVHLHVNLIFYLVVFRTVRWMSRRCLWMWTMFMLYFCQIKSTVSEYWCELVLLFLMSMAHSEKLLLLFAVEVSWMRYGKSVDGSWGKVVNLPELPLQLFWKSIIVFAEGIEYFILIHIA